MPVICGMVFLWGLMAGSFLSVCVYRIPRGQGVIFGFSRCTSCGKHLKVFDLVPVISYMVLGGKCRYCGRKISTLYPLIELITGMLFVLLFQKFSLGFLFMKYAVLVSVLTAVSFIDMEHCIIPGSLLGIGLAAGVVFAVIEGKGTAAGYIAGMAAGSGILLLVILASGGGMGMGDMKLMGVIGLFLGWKLSLLTLFSAFVIGGIAGTVLVLTGKKTGKDAVPFGPFLSLAALISVLAGQQIISLYLHITGGA